MKTILVVDDEESVVNLVSAVLEREGYKVFKAVDWAHALDISDRYKGVIDLLITNHCLKAESGREVAKDLEADQPAMKVLQISGYPEKYLEQDGTKVPNGSFLQKPFLPRQLVDKVDTLLK